jgi:hypothetical protein
MSKASKAKPIPVVEPPAVEPVIEPEVVPEEKVDEVDHLSLVSEDDEWDTYGPKLSPPSNFAFYEYEFGGIQDALQELTLSLKHFTPAVSRRTRHFLDHANNLTNNYRQTQNRTQKTNQGKDFDNEFEVGTRTFNIKDFQRTQEQTKRNTKISQFRPPQPRFDGSYYPDDKLLTQLYRTPCRDPSGTLILNLGRDETKGAKAWKTPQPDQDIPNPSFASCAETYRTRVLKHMDDVVEKVEQEYKALPSRTQEQSTLKAQVGADLNNLKQRRSQLKRELDDYVDQEIKRHQQHKTKQQPSSRHK